MTARRYVRCRDTVNDVETDVLSTDKRIGTRFLPVRRRHWPDSHIPRPDKRVLHVGAFSYQKHQED